MPLSKARDKARKRIERAKHVFQPNSNLMLVQPVRPNVTPVVRPTPSPNILDSAATKAYLQARDNRRDPIIFQ